MLSDLNQMEQDKKNWRRDELATRIDLRMPNEVYDRVVEIATAAGEKVNPKSGQVRLTATLNKLIEIGIRHLSDDNPTGSDFSPIVNPIDIGLIARVDKLENICRELSDKLESDSSRINIGLSREEIESIEARLSQLENKSLDRLEKTEHPTPTPEESLSLAELAQKLGKTRQSIEAKRKRGTLSEWGYKAVQTDKTWFYFPIE